MQSVSWAQIKCALEERGHTLASLARKLEVSRSAISKVKVRPSPRVQAAIARAVGMKPEELWPERYLAAPMRRAA
jgi:Ner family transcriptional regulator